MSKVLKFSYNPRQIKNIAYSAINEFEANIKEIINIPRADRNFKNTLLAFENAKDNLRVTTQIPQFLSLVSDDIKVRKASEELKLKMGQYLVDLMTREDVFYAINEYAEKNEKGLQSQEKHLLKKRLLDFRKSGLGLETHKRNSLRKISRELVGLNLEFQKNLREVNEVLEVTQKELKGLSEDYKVRLKRTSRGGYLISMNYPDYNPFMENAEDDDARRRLCQMFNNRCADLNIKLLERAIVLHRKQARLLGYPTYADYVLDDRMAKNSKVVFDFLNGLQVKLKKKARTELKAKLKLKGNGDKVLNIWETAYYNNLIKKTKYFIDHEKVKEYFPLETVLKGMLDVFGELFGVSFISMSFPTWHKDVRSYEVRNSDGSVAGHFYLDIFPREGKYKHTICSSLRSERKLDDDTYELPVAAILANFSPPSRGVPPLLKFNEVHTLFHEFGHTLQILFSRARYSRFASVNAAWDFVEVPSTTLQQWVYEPLVLRRISGHYKNKSKKLPEEIITKLISARNMDAGMYYLRMIALSLIDMRYHTVRRGVNTTKVYRDIMEKVSLVSIDKDSHPEASFGHLMGGYSASYYSYIWDEVIAKDIFGVFKSLGVMNPKIGRKYRKSILVSGASCDETGQVEGFLGRPFSETAFLKSVGVT